MEITYTVGKHVILQIFQIGLSYNDFEYQGVKVMQQLPTVCHSHKFKGTNIIIAMNIKALNMFVYMHLNESKFCLCLRVHYV